MKKIIYLFRRKHWKYIIFFGPVERKVATIDKNQEENTNNLFCILPFTDSARFVASSLSNLVNNLSEGIHRIKCKYRHDNKICGTCGIKNKYCVCFLEYKTLKMI